MGLKKTGRKSKVMGVLLIITMILQCLPLIALANANTAMVGQWQFNEGTCRVATDTSGNGNNGKICGATWVDGKVGKALSFDGNDYVEIPHRANLNPCNAISVEAWINPASIKDWQRIVSKSPHPNTDYSMFIRADKRVGVSVKMGKVAQTVYSLKNTLQVGTWTHVVGTYDGCRMRMYINGKQVNSFPLKGKINVNKGVLRIGGDPKGDNFRGIIDEVSIYNKALTACEVLNHYQAAMKDKEEDKEEDKEIVLAVPTNIKAQATMTSITLTWDAVSNATGYDVEADGKILDNGAATTFVHSELAMASQHSYCVRAKNDKTVSSWSKVIVKTTIGDIEAPTIPQNLRSTEITSNSVALTWDAASDNVGVTGYEVYQGAVLLGKTAETNYTATKLQPGVEYSFMVKAFDGAGNVSESSNQLNVTTNFETQQAIAAGSDFCMYLKNDGTVWAWGANTHGELGDGTTTLRKAPVQVSGLAKVTTLATQNSYSLALKSDGTVWAWGNNYSGQLGDGTTITKKAPVQVKGLTGVRKIAAGYNHSLVLKNDGTVWAWGNNARYQLGDGTTTLRKEPIQVMGLGEVEDLTVGYYHSVALKADGTVWTWGDNQRGQLGDGTTRIRTAPVQVNGLTNIVAITTGNSFNLALKSDGTVWAWGYNEYGQLGDGTTELRVIPVQVNGLTNVVALETGNSFNLALKADGTVWSWGYNGYGQLGDNTIKAKTEPVQVMELEDGKAIAAGSYHSMALKKDGTVWAWGYNGYYQLGDGTIINRHLPIQVDL
ncbi:MAG: fibronectin type III domain-containing protein [Desulfitobacteriaceae bacterium]|nr:fibronectin type III domain-containing protein [Desulfitobacteriaceae bacterium]